MNDVWECDPVPERLCAHEHVEDGELIDTEEDQEEIHHSQVD